jgi:hypothetical protein
MKTIAIHSGMVALFVGSPTDPESELKLLESGWADEYCGVVPAKSIAIKYKQDIEKLYDFLGDCLGRSDAK